MTPQKFITRLNWRQIVVHFIATWFFMYSFQTFAILQDTNLINIFRQSGKLNNISGSDISYFLLWTTLSCEIGLLVAVAISLTISIKRKWFWFNSFLVLIIVHILARFDRLGWTYMKIIFLKPGEFFENTKMEFFVDGIILLALGLLTFFLPFTNRFIAKGNNKKA